MNLVKTKYGEMQVIPSDSVISRSLTMYGEWAKNEIDFLKEFITPGAHVLDIGSYIGTHALAFAQFTGSQGKVYAFEPRREIFQILSTNISVNQCTQVVAFNMGVADQVEQATLKPLNLDTPDNFGGQELASQEATADGYQATITTIDSMHLERVDFMKIDVEGMEQRVLNGARQTITNRKPSIFCECNSIDGGAGVLAFAHSIGYKVFGVLSDAFSKNNFNGVGDNFFGEFKELGLLLVPLHRLEHANSLLNLYRLCPVDTLDTLALLLLHKPQYSDAELASTPAAKLLGTMYPSPLSRLLAAQLESQVLEVHRVKNSFSWQVTKPIRFIAYLGRRLSAVCGFDN